jgi:hypothetical protein
MPEKKRIYTFIYADWYIRENECRKRYSEIEILKAFISEV